MFSLTWHVNRKLYDSRQTTSKVDTQSTFEIWKQILRGSASYNLSLSSKTDSESVAESGLKLKFVEENLAQFSFEHYITIPNFSQQMWAVMGIKTPKQLS